MSASEMKKIVNMLNESKQINESYESRIEQAFDEIMREISYSDIGEAKPVTKKDFIDKLARLRTNGMRVIDTHNGELPTDLETLLPEIRIKNGNAWKDAAKDLIKLGTAKKAFVKAKKEKEWWEDDEPAKPTQDEIVELGHFMMDQAGNSFPDGDPHDALPEFFRKKGWGETGYDYVNQAAKAVLGTNTYGEYLAQLWDDVYGDAKGDHDYWSNSDPKTRGPEPTMLRMLGNNNPWISEGILSESKMVDTMSDALTELEKNGVCRFHRGYITNDEWKRSYAPAIRAKFPNAWWTVNSNNHIVVTAK